MNQLRGVSLIDHLSDFDLLGEAQTLAPFSALVLDYLNELSKLLFKDPRAKIIPM